MNVNNKHYRTVWMDDSVVYMIDQTLLPFEFKIYKAPTYQDCCFAIKTMITRGAGAIGATAGFAMAQAYLSAPYKGFKEFVLKAKKEIEATRPTARNLFYAVDRIFEAGKISVENAVKEAQKMENRRIRK